MAEGNSKYCSIFVFFLILAGLGCQIAGFVTDFWLVGSSSKSTDIDKIKIGLFHQTIVFQNGTASTTESSLNIFAEQCICLAIAGASTLACFIILFKTVHVLVGISSFVLLSLMVISVFYVFIQVFERKDVVAEQNMAWPELKLHWSFGLVTGGILLNIVTTVIFLVILLIRGERKSAGTTKLFDHTMDPQKDTLPIITVITIESHDCDYTNAGFYQNSGSTTANNKYVASKNNRGQRANHQSTASPVDHTFVDTDVAVSVNQTDDGHTYTGRNGGKCDHMYAGMTRGNKDKNADKSDERVEGTEMSQVELREVYNTYYNQTFTESEIL